MRGENLNEEQATCHVDNGVSDLCSMSSMSTFTQISRLFHGLFISVLHNRFMRCDLHVHSTASGMCNTPGLSRVCRESYNDPLEVYDRLKRLGMSVVTMTDHDSIDAVEVLRRFPDFFLSEEVTAQMPSGTEMHLGVYRITEREHIEIQRRRKDFIALLMYLTERKLFFSVNHVFSGLTGRREEDDFNWFASYVPAFEVRNGQMWPAANVAAERLARRLGKIGIGGSDAHTISGVGSTFTEVPGVGTVDEFMAGLRSGSGVVHGVHGSLAKLTTDVYRIALAFFGEQPWALPVLPLTALVPAITAGHWLNEMRFCRKWSAALESEGRRPRLLWKLDPGLEANLAS
jgi:predicted metal-dependent phosphoesterase TrpH